MSRSLSALLVCAAALVATPRAQAITTPGQSFDGKMSLIYDVLTGEVLVEHTPHINPSISDLQITSSSGALVFPGFNLQTQPPAANLFPTVMTSTSPTAINIHWTGGDFIGTGASLGFILPALPPNPSFFFGDLTIRYNSFGEAIYSRTGDLIFAAIGATQNNPILPTLLPNGSFRFVNGASGNFFDPPATTGYVYTMEGTSNFTKVGLPVGLGSNFKITSSQGVVPNLGEGASHSFTGAGVSTFSITGINPPVDGTQPDAFPVYLEFSTDFADFTMTAVPEPSALVLAALAGIAACRNRRCPALA